jgi:hypothetical protein
VEIFETKSRYYANPNAGIAKVFSNLAVTITAVLIGLVLLIWLGITCLHRHWEAKLTHNVQRQLEAYGFEVKGLELIDNLDEGSGQEQLRFVFAAKYLAQPKLLNGKACDYARIVATTRSWGGTEFIVENIELDKLPGGLHILNWVDWVYDQDHPVIAPQAAAPPDSSTYLSVEEWRAKGVALRHQIDSAFSQ